MTVLQFHKLLIKSGEDKAHRNTHKHKLAGDSAITECSVCSEAANHPLCHTSSHGYHIALPCISHWFPTGSLYQSFDL